MLGAKKPRDPEGRVQGDQGRGKAGGNVLKRENHKQGTHAWHIHSAQISGSPGLGMHSKKRA